MRILLFIAIIMLFGSLSKPGIIPCGREIIVKFYRNKKIIDSGHGTKFWCQRPSEGWAGHQDADSLTVEVYLQSENKK